MLTSVCFGGSSHCYGTSYERCACFDCCSGARVINRNFVVYLYIFFHHPFLVRCLFLSDVLRSTMLVKDSDKAFLASLKIIFSQSLLLVVSTLFICHNQ